MVHSTAPCSSRVYWGAPPLPCTSADTVIGCPSHTVIVFCPVVVTLIDCVAPGGVTITSPVFSQPSLCALVKPTLYDTEPLGASVSVLGPGSVNSVVPPRLTVPASSVPFAA